jgi:DNA polymerase-3 subunit delta'
MQGCACVTASVLDRMRALAVRPPQSLVLEGGDAAGRKAAALAWAKALNCPERGCGQCAACRQIDGGVFRDLIVLDKAVFEAAGKNDDKSSTDVLRELMPTWGQPPAGTGFRVTIFSEAHELHPNAANLLLKTLEEPRPGNVFVLTAPQRERLLQTLVSRSFVLALPWPRPEGLDADVAEWIAALLGFLETGRGWFERTGTKGAADRNLAQRIIVGLERELVAALSGAAGDAAAGRLARLGPAGLRRLDLALAQAQEALSQPTAPPALVLDWLATTLIAKGGAPAAPRPGR